MTRGSLIQVGDTKLITHIITLYNNMRLAFILFIDLFLYNNMVFIAITCDYKYVNYMYQVFSHRCSSCDGCKVSRANLRYAVASCSFLVHHVPIIIDYIFFIIISILGYIFVKLFCLHVTCHRQLTDE